METSFEDCDEFARPHVGLSFFVGLAGPMIAVRPRAQLSVAERCVRHIKSGTVLPIDRRDFAMVPGLGYGVLILAFPNGDVPGALSLWQIDLVELSYMCSFGPQTLANQLMILRRFGLPGEKTSANEWLVERGRRSR